MGRPPKRRRVCQLPEISQFAPCDSTNAETVELTVDEYETIRLIDLLGFTQEECASQFSVARTTVQAIYDSARKKLADVIVNGKCLAIRGGSYDICCHSSQCPRKDAPSHGRPCCQSARVICRSQASETGRE